MEDSKCQSMYLETMAEGRARLPKMSVIRRIKVEFRRRFSYRTIRQIRKTIDNILVAISLSKIEQKIDLKENVKSKTRLKKGDIVRVRSEEEIRLLLDRWKQYKGCGFMDDMWKYCGTTQKVLKSVERFLDERDYQVKRVKGIVLLEGLNCQGTPIFGRCDRNCYYFWREEWLEKIDAINCQ